MPYTGEMRFRVPKGFGDVTPYIRPARVLAEKALDRGLAQSGLTRTVNGVRIQVNAINGQITADLSAPTSPPVELPEYEPRETDVEVVDIAPDIPVADDPDIPNYIIEECALALYMRWLEVPKHTNTSLPAAEASHYWHFRYAYSAQPNMYYWSGSSVYYAYFSDVEYDLHNAMVENETRDRRLPDPNMIDYVAFRSVWRWKEISMYDSGLVLGEQPVLDVGPVTTLDMITVPVVDMPGYESDGDASTETKNVRMTMYGISTHEWLGDTVWTRDRQYYLPSVYSFDIDNPEHIQLTLTDSDSAHAEQLRWYPSSYDVPDSETRVFLSSELTGNPDVSFTYDLSIGGSTREEIHYLGWAYKPHRFLGVTAEQNSATGRRSYKVLVEYKKVEPINHILPPDYLRVP